MINLKLKILGYFSVFVDTECILVLGFCLRLVLIVEKKFQDLFEFIGVLKKLRPIDLYRMNFVDRI